MHGAAALDTPPRNENGGAYHGDSCVPGVANVKIENYIILPLTSSARSSILLWFLQHSESVAEMLSSATTRVSVRNAHTNKALKAFKGTQARKRAVVYAATAEGTEKASPESGSKARSVAWRIAAARLKFHAKIARGLQVVSLWSYTGRCQSG
jgi:hypothetical protein